MLWPGSRRRVHIFRTYVIEKVDGVRFMFHVMYIITSSSMKLLVRQGRSLKSTFFGGVPSLNIDR